MKKSNCKFDKDKLFEALSKRAEGFFYSEEILEYGEREDKAVKTPKSDNEKDEAMISDEDELKETFKKGVSKKPQKQKHDIYSGRETDEAGAENRSQKRETAERCEETRLVLLKKKVTTHYVPPDMSAIKMLFEVGGEEVGNRNSVLDEMSDEELLELKRELIAELSEK